MKTFATACVIRLISYGWNQGGGLGGIVNYTTPNKTRVIDACRSNKPSHLTTTPRLVTPGWFHVTVNLVQYRLAPVDYVMSRAVAFHTLVLAHSFIGAVPSIQTSSQLVSIVCCTNNSQPARQAMQNSAELDRWQIDLRFNFSIALPLFVNEMPSL